jgi:peptidoglycan/LPS O-acetylase OafA/YrhL
VNQRSNNLGFGHYPALDGLRGVAVLIVVVTHFALWIPSIKRFFEPGLLGVDIFFVLSGFLITSILLKEFQARKKIDLKKFYIRRCLRLTPAYWLILAITFIFTYQIFPPATAVRLHANNAFAGCLLYISNWQRAFGVNLDPLGHTWSLAIEEQFYLMWCPLLCWMLSRLRQRALIVLATLLLNLILIMVLESRIQWGTFGKDYLYNATDCRFNALLFGALTSMIFVWQLSSEKILASRAFNLVALAALGLSVLLASNFEESNQSTYRVLPWFAAACSILILWLVTRSTSPFHSLLRFPALVWIGKVSYGLYLWHNVVLAFVRQFQWPLWMQFFFYITLSLITTACSYYFLERPFLKLKERFAAPTADFENKSTIPTDREEPLAASMLQVQQSLPT